MKIIKKITMCLIIVSLLLDNKIHAATNTNDWVITDSEGYEVDKERVSWISVHNAGSKDEPRYRTLYYHMSRQDFKTQYKFTEGPNANIIKSKPISVRIRNIETTTERKKREYSFLRQDFLDIAAGSIATEGLGITAADIRNNGNKINVYLNPVYDRYIVYDDGTEEGREADLPGDNIFGYQEMLRWFPSFSDDKYNIKFTLTASNIFKVEFVAIDENNNVIESNLDGENLEAIYKQQIQFPLPENRRQITKSGIKYDYANKWKYEWKETSGSSEVNKSLGDYTGSTAAFSAPDVIPGTTLTVYFKYKKAPSERYKYKIVAETTNGTLIQNLRSSTDTYGGATLDYGIPNALKKLHDGRYTYQNKWYLTYTNRSPEQAKRIDKNEVDISNFTMPDAKKDSEAVFHMVYGEGPVPPTPIPTPGITPRPTEPPAPTPEIPEQIIPEGGSESLPFTNVKSSGVIKADARGSEKFVAALGVPTTESLYGEVIAMEYLLGYSFVKRTGIEYFNVKVTKKYTLQWYSERPPEAGGPELIEDEQIVEQVISVPRAYGYWEIENLECYKIDNAVLRNYALPGESITLNPNLSYYTPPSITVRHSSSKSDHVIPPNEAITGITITETISAPSGDESSKPNIPREDFTYIANSRTGKARVKNDYIYFNGRTVMSDQISEWNTPNLDISALPQCTRVINNNVLYKPNNIIEATKLNGVYQSTGTITYTALAQVNAQRPYRPQYSIDGINNVVIHTPVVCKPSITADNDKYVQLKNPYPDCVQLVLDPDPTLSDFVVHISNTGSHSPKLGYYTRDFSKSLRDPNVSYISSINNLLKNQVKFPFDVYIDKGILNQSSDDDFIKAGTWIVIGRSSPRFYLPMTVNEGVYTVQFRTIAVNGDPFINNTETYANTLLTNYVATETINVEVSGRIYGLKIYDVSDYPNWESIFRVPKSADLKKDNTSYPDGTSLAAYNSGRSYTYTLGTNDQYGNDTGRNSKYTFPLVDGSHPKFKTMGILKTGYLVRFSLDTTGNMFSDACKISIKPNFYYVDKDGKNRVAVDLYYKEEINNKSRHLVKVGSPLDQTNMKTYSTGDLSLAIPKAEQKQTAALRGMTLAKYMATRSPMFNFSDIRLNYAFRTYVNNSYLNKFKSYPSYAGLTATGKTDGDIVERMQRWYGQYYIPNEVMVVKKNFDVMDYADKHGVDNDESFWLKDGYIIVNFTIETVGENGSRRLSYINASNYLNNGNCSMWALEGPVVTKQSHKGPKFNFYAGDIFVYYANKRMSSDYESGAVY